jgi:hypothetical protein
LNNTLLIEQWVIENIRKGSKKFLKSNENEDTICQILWDSAKEVLREFIVISTNIRQLEKNQINNLIVHIKILEKQE